MPDPETPVGVTETPVPETPKAQPAVDPELVQRLQNKIHAYDRILATPRQELDAIKQKVAEPPKPEPASTAALTQDEYDKLVEAGQGKEAVRGLGKEVATQGYQEMFAQQQVQTALHTRQTALEHSKQAVLQKYPDLDPEGGNPDSEVSKAYTQVLNEYPTLFQVENGPEIAMALMEARKHAPAAPNPDARRVRATQASLPPSRAGGAATPMALTAEDKRYIENNRIPGGPERVAQIRRTLEQRGEVSA